MGIRRILVGNSVELLEKEAFDGCNSLETVHIGAALRHVGRWALGSSGKLRTIEVDAANRKYAAEDGILYTKDFRELLRCPAARKGCVRVRDGVRHIGVSAFEWCEELERIELPESVTLIDQLAFSKCHALMEILLPKGIVAIKREAFADCTTLKSVCIPASCLRIGYRAFTGCKCLASVQLPPTLVRLADYAFFECESLASMSVPDNLACLGSCVFSRCTALREIYLPKAFANKAEDLRLFDECPQFPHVLTIHTPVHESDAHHEE